MAGAGMADMEGGGMVDTAGAGTEGAGMGDTAEAEELEEVSRSVQGPSDTSRHS